MIDTKTVRSFLEYHNFQFNRPFAEKGDTYTYNWQFLGRHDFEYQDLRHCLEKWLSVQLGVKWREMLRDKADLSYFDFVERQDIQTAWGYWQELFELCQDQE